MISEVRIVGMGRAGASFAAALGRVGWAVSSVSGRSPALCDAASGVELTLICVPDAAIAEVAAVIRPGEAAVAHVAGSLGLDVLAPHARCGAIHPLSSLPNAEVGAERLLAAGWFAVAGDPIVDRVVQSLGGHRFAVADDARAVYHAAACVAANHVVALLGQVERLAAAIAVPTEAYLALTRQCVDNVGRLGAVAALTGPAARGDDATIARHLEHLPPDERETYAIMVSEAKRLARERG